MRRGRALYSLFCNKPCAQACTPSKKAMKTDASLTHALVVIFLEYFAWGLLTVPVINVSFNARAHNRRKPDCFLQVLAETFPQNKFLFNGLILGLKVC